MSWLQDFGPPCRRAQFPSHSVLPLALSCLSIFIIPALSTLLPLVSPSQSIDSARFSFHLRLTRLTDTCFQPSHTLHTLRTVAVSCVANSNSALFSATLRGPHVSQTFCDFPVLPILTPHCFLQRSEVLTAVTANQTICDYSQWRRVQFSRYFGRTPSSVFKAERWFVKNFPVLKTEAVWSSETHHFFTIHLDRVILRVLRSCNYCTNVTSKWRRNEQSRIN
jgi:hypothetical protein